MSYTSIDFGFGEGQDVFLKSGCKVSNCWATRDRSWLDKSDALIFQGEPMDFNISDLPSMRWPHQRYIYLNWEALPPDDLVNGTPAYHKLSQDIPPNFFNWTMTHRRDSDIHNPVLYGALKRKSQPSRRPASTPSKIRLMAWFVSHCNTSSRRELYMKELSRHIPVDVYGKCGNLTCEPHNSDDECGDLMGQYKFYFSAENSLCPDYVTEKFYRPLIHGSVPVVYGAANYSAYVPRSSFISVTDFSSPKQLADYLLLLDRNDALYQSYFEWKKDWEVVRPDMSGYCNLCEKLNDPLEPVKFYANLSDWWFDKAPCKATASFLDAVGVPWK